MTAWQLSRTVRWSQRVAASLSHAHSSWPDVPTEFPHFFLTFSRLLFCSPPPDRVSKCVHSMHSTARGGLASYPVEPCVRVGFTGTANRGRRRRSAVKGTRKEHNSDCPGDAGAGLRRCPPSSGSGSGSPLAGLLVRQSSRTQTLSSIQPSLPPSHCASFDLHYTFGPSFLQGCEVSSVSVKQIAASLTGHERLTDIALSENRIDDVGAAALASTVAKSTSLCSLHLWRT